LGSAEIDGVSGVWQFFGERNFFGIFRLARKFSISVKIFNALCLFHYPGLFLREFFPPDESDENQDNDRDAGPEKRVNKRVGTATGYNFCLSECIGI
jgi:hypothetical protein